MNAESFQMHVAQSNVATQQAPATTSFRDRVDSALGRFHQPQLHSVKSTNNFRERLTHALGTSPDRPEPPPRAWKKSLVDSTGRREFVEDYLFPREIELPPFGAMTCVIAPSADCRPDVHGQDEMIFVYRGCGEVTVEDARMSVATGDVVFIPRNRNHLIKNSSDKNDLAFFSVWWPRSVSS